MLASRNASRKLLIPSCIRGTSLHTSSRRLNDTISGHGTHLAEGHTPSIEIPLHPELSSQEYAVDDESPPPPPSSPRSNSVWVTSLLRSISAKLSTTGSTTHPNTINEAEGGKTGQESLQGDIDTTQTQSPYEWPEGHWSNLWAKGEDVPTSPSQPLEDPSMFPTDSELERPPHEDSPYKDVLEITDGLPHPAMYYNRVVQGTVKEPSDGTKFMQDLRSPTPMRPIANLAHGLDRVLFNPGVHWVQDPRSRVYNFSPMLQSIPKVEEFAFDRVTGFIKSSSDNDLRTLAKQENCRFVGSTSSLTGMLSHVYFLLSSFRPPSMDQLSYGFMNQSKKFAAALDSSFSYGQRLPVSVILNYKDGVYATDYDPSDPGMTERNILTWQGTMLEKYLTASKEEFDTLLRRNPPAKGPVDKRREAYRYAKCGSYVMRSQLDCHDSRLPGTGVFDLKTRAALPIRKDLFNYEANSGYLIRTLHGAFESFEREYYDLIRAAFLKYSFQARIGNMDGIFAAYHNTARIFGFQYIPLEEMDRALYGQKDVGARIFEKCLRMLEVINNEVTQLFPNQSVQCLWDTDDDGQTTHVWVQPKDWSIEQGPPPVVQLDITVSNYVNGKRVFGHDLPESLPGNKWSVRWEIKTAELSSKQIFQNKRAAKEKLNIYWSLPAGMNKEEAMKWVTDLDFAGKGAPPELAKPSVFRPPGDFIKHLRHLSHRGKKETERLELAEAGKAKVIWGNPELFVLNEEEEKAQTVRKAEKGKGKMDRKLMEETLNASLADEETLKRKRAEATMKARRRRDKKKAAKLARQQQQQQQQEEERSSIPPISPWMFQQQANLVSEARMNKTRRKAAIIAQMLDRVYPRPLDTLEPPGSLPLPALPSLSLSWTTPPER